MLNPIMMKKIAILFVECVGIFTLGILIVIAFTGGFSVMLGPVKLKAHGAQNPLILSISLVILRRILTGTFFQNSPLFSILRRFLESPAARTRMLAGGVMLAVLVSAITLIHPLQRGLKAEYYQNDAWTGSPIMTTIDRALTLDNIRYEFPAMRSQYGIQWTGAIFIPKSGAFQFITSSDDGDEVWIDDQRVIDNSGFHGVQEKSGAVDLKQGFHAIKIRYMQGSGGAEFNAYWVQPGKKRESLSNALLVSAQPAHSASLWLYWLQQFFLFFLLILAYLLGIILALKCADMLTKWFPAWRREIYAITIFALAAALLRLVIFALGVWIDEYAFVRYAGCLLIIGIGSFITGSLAVKMLSELTQMFRHPHNLAKDRSLRKVRYEIISVALFFALFLCLGLRIVGDYGMSVDEKNSRIRGLNYLAYLTDGDRQIFIDHGQFHGPAFEIVLAWLETVLHLTDGRDVYLMRHIATFLLFYLSVFFFYLLCRERFDDWRIGLLGCVFFLLSPRIFADAFYNPKDLPFLSVFIISIYTLIKYLERKTWRRAALHAFVCGVLIDIRIVGILVPAFTLFFLIGEAFWGSLLASAWEKTALYGVLLILFTIACYPLLWENSLQHWRQTFSEMAQYPWNGTVLYSGKRFLAADLPWHYIPVWILISTPLFYVVNFLAGVLAIGKSLLSKPLRLFSERRHEMDFMMFCWFFAPILAIILLKSVLYDAWRQMFYIYPAFLLIALRGLLALFHGISSKCAGRSVRVVKIALVMLSVFSLLPTAYFMIKYHPYQNLYFNQLAGRNMEAVKNNFDGDYWALTYRKALEYLVRNDAEPEIAVYTANFPGELFATLLPAQDRQRFSYPEKLEDAKYFISNYRWHEEDYPYQNEVYAITIGGAKFLSVYRLNSK